MVQVLPLGTIWLVRRKRLVLMEPSTDPYLVGVAVDVRTAFDETQPGRVCMVSLHMLVCVCI